MEYAEAKKLVQVTKPKENYMLIKLSYDHSLVLPYKDGLAFMASLANAEQLTGDYDKKRISAIEPENIITSLMSPDEYARYKIAALLNISVAYVKKYESPPF